jgi:ParB-like chromosome segregation protein Spo0J
MMQIVKISEVKPNPKNPRIIKDGKFQKLVKSIQEFPDMLNKRPLIVFTDVNNKYVVLGGNMRLKACKEIGLKEIPIIIADEWTEEQKNEFLIKDNVGFGEWDWDSLANEWDAEKLTKWGLDVPEIKEPEEQAEIEFSEYIDEQHNYVVLYFDNRIDWLQAETHFDIKTVTSKRSNGKPWSSGVGRVINGANYLKNLKK